MNKLVFAAVAVAAGMSMFATSMTGARAESDWRSQNEAVRAELKKKGAAAPGVKQAATTKTVTKVIKTSTHGYAKASAGRSSYSSIINKYASAYGVPSSLAHAVVRVESNFRPNARGSAGEIGLMQIKPSTARMMGYNGSAKGLYNPDTNIKYGMKYLAQAHKLGGRSVCGTILKYNAGHGAKRMNPVSARYCSKVKAYL